MLEHRELGKAARDLEGAHEPARLTTSAALPAISCPLKSIEPASGGTSPDTTLNNVVLPAPFGPISPVIPPPRP